ncbi:uncharacterized protein si:dkey-9i23.6 isoform X2 [Electrophorus electricus]|uniref:uncharacterized protein si:dkey-9i23.6 isoform X2 n=1 Tax=Electrophorus electricus TaxID=8005 RepID=UPI0015CFF1B7|nr:uncharacterized protein si:dkey-9i23.6 isoform X2 [Electrophorus electricus]
MAEEGQAPNGISLIQSMLNRLKVNERVQRSALHISLHNSLSKDMDENAENSRIDGSLSEQPRKSNMYFRQAQATPEQEAALLAMDYNSTSSKMQKQVTSEEETEPPANPPPEPQHSPLPSPKEESPTTVQVSFQRTFTLQDFTLTLEPINLLEEVLIGEEWSRFLPVKSGPPQGEANNQSQMEKTINVLEEALIGENCASFLPVKDRPIVIENDYSQRVNTSHFSKDSQSQNLVITQDKSTDKEQSVSSQSEKGQVLIINSGIKHKKPEVPENEHLMDDHEYAVVDVLIQPNSKQNKRNSKDFLQLDLSAVKSRGVLDNSALKSRIYLSKKRKHRPPKLRRKVCHIPHCSLTQRSP